jgi:hypothetical protein
MKGMEDQQAAMWWANSGPPEDYAYMPDYMTACTWGHGSGSANSKDKANYSDKGLANSEEKANYSMANSEEKAKYWDTSEDKAGNDWDKGMAGNDKVDCGKGADGNNGDKEVKLKGMVGSGAAHIPKVEVTPLPFQVKGVKLSPITIDHYDQRTGEVTKRTWETKVPEVKFEHPEVWANNAWWTAGQDHTMCNKSFKAPVQFQ